MSFLGVLGIGTDVGTPILFWALVIGSVAAVVAIGIGMETLIAEKVHKEPAHKVTACDVDGHHYRANPAGWECSTCAGKVIHQPTGLASELDVPGEAAAAAAAT